MILSIAIIFSACEQKQQDDKNVSSEAKTKAVKSVVTPKNEIKPECLPSTGNAMEDGEETVCQYNTGSLALAYAAVVKANASKDDFGYALLKKALPAKDLEDKFD